MTTDQIMAEIAALHKTLKLSVYTTRYGDVDKIFHVSLEFESDGITVETKAEGNNFRHALNEAWTKLQVTAGRGLRPGALVPPVEQAAIQPPHRGPQTADDEIPF